MSKKNQEKVNQNETVVNPKTSINKTNVPVNYTETKKVNTKIEWNLPEHIKEQINIKIEEAEKVVNQELKDGKIDSETATKRLELITVEKFVKRLTETIFNAILTTAILPISATINDKIVDLSKKKINGKSPLSDIVNFQVEIEEVISSGKISIMNEKNELKKHYVRGFFYCTEINEKSKFGYQWVDIKSINKKDFNILKEKAFCAFYSGYRINL